MTFNEKIDKYMIENNIKNLKQLAKLSNIPYTTLKDFYDKKSADNSRLSTIRKLAQFMNCSMDYLAYDKINIEFNDNIDFKKIAIEELISKDFNDEKFDEFESMFNEYKNDLTDDDKEMISFIIEKRKKENKKG